MRLNRGIIWLPMVVGVILWVFIFILAIYCVSNATEREPAICCIIGQSQVYLGPNGMWCAYYWQDFDLDDVADVVSKYCYNPESGLLELIDRADIDDENR